MIARLLFAVAGMSNTTITFIAMAVGGFYYLTAFDPGAEFDKNIVSTNTQLSQENQKVAESEKALRDMENIKAQLGALAEQYKYVSAQLPTELRMADIIKAVDVISKTTRVQIRSKEPSDPIKKDIIEVIPLKIQMDGSFSQITLFMYYISSLERIMKVQNFSINLPEGNPRRADNLQFEGQVLSYRYIGAAQESQQGGTR